MEYKGYLIESLGTFPMLRIRAKGKGRVPDKLTGVYTTTTEAMRSVDFYLTSLMKGKRNGDPKSTSTD